MLIIAFIFQLATAPINSELKIERLYVQGDVLSYRGYQVSRRYNPKTGQSWATVKRNGKVLARHSSEGEKGLTRFGIFSLLGGNTKQLVIEQSSGGAHCCNSWWAYDLYPEFRLAFRSDSYSISDDWGEASVIDIDKDGIFELIFSSNGFAYFSRLHFSESPLPKVVFRYDRAAKRYYPAGERYSAYLLKGIGEEIEEIKALNKDADPLPLVLDVMLRYVYAGKKKLAWSIFEPYYTMSDKQSMRREIRRRLNTDKIYRSIYGRV
jgi:hypothetical protein